MSQITINASVEQIAPARYGPIEPFVGRPPAEAMVRITLSRAGVLMVRLIGPPGAGKTELIRATLGRFADPQRVAVITVNPASARDADRLRCSCGHVDHIDASIPTASAVWRAISGLDLAGTDLIVVEGCSGMAPLTDIGQDATVAVLSYTGGDDKAAEYRTLIEAASLVLLNKSDMRLPFGFDSVAFQKDVRSANADADVLDISAASGQGMDQWFTWLERIRLAKKSPLAHDRQSSDWFIG